MANNETEKLTIQVEREGAKLSFDNSNVITALFNPEKLAFNKSANWQKQDAAQRDTPELQFTNSDPRTLSVSLFFDTYDSPDLNKDDVRDYTDPVFHLMTVEQHGDKHRPPVCRLSWGAAGVFFQGVLERLDQQFTMFTEDGTPVRATLTCSFKEWRTNYDDLNRQNRQSSDLVKLWVVRHGDSLSRVAAEEYGDSGLWRPIAKANAIDDPRSLVAGRRLLVPPLTGRAERR